MNMDFNSENFNNQIQNSSVPVIVDFFAIWCGPCKMLSPVLERIENKYEDSIAFTKVDIDEFEEIADEYGIMSVPTLLFFDKGKLVRTEVGFMPFEKLEEIIETEFCVSNIKA